ncbi:MULTISPECIES: hypothetical protein [unclassified Burkholderia]|uniref:hypothetical protein n=1 Tax=unclassified Burkholderia TaxID=2613784 RepID=UPI0014235CF3|nr:MULTISPECIES: hypothetical protein [unclassified Burkholderia]NIE81901.1 hypothetical protein [Burkholderia sp. Tr-860]NIF61135.1 hypothetical protein [Burkholderia sp. Cy-647]NIF93992.1 hypothetical protein [Burkholderia sp. Ax-1720]
MLKSLFLGAFKSPGKFLALCLALYIAAHSIIVTVFAVVAAVGYLKSSSKKEPQSRERDSADGRELDNAPQQVERSQTGPARSNVKVPPAPQRQYAKSAVVIPLKARSSSTSAQSMKMGTK